MILGSSHPPRACGVVHRSRTAAGGGFTLTELLVTIGLIVRSQMGKHVPLNDADGGVASAALTHKNLSGLVLKGVSHPVCISNPVGSRAHGVAFRASVKNDGGSVGFEPTIQFRGIHFY